MKKVVIPAIVLAIIIILLVVVAKINTTRTPTQDKKVVINELIKNWPSLEKTISTRPVLGSTVWSAPNYIQFLDNNTLLIEFEDGHIALAGLLNVSSASSQTINFKFERIITESFPFAAVQYQDILKLFNLKSPPQTYTKSIFRDGKIIDFSDWTAVPENPFVKTEWQKIKIAVLDPEEKTNGKSVGCDHLVLIDRNIPKTDQILNATLKNLFALDDEKVDGWFNIVARVNETLKFDRAAIENGAAKIYLTGSFPTGYLYGVCDDPRLQIQIEETAFQFSSVKSVETYLNGKIIDWKALNSLKG
ncbi:MAG: hypothetical protein WCX12_03055 [Candidatus Paceibacterota bacterium]|jgi:hypothetical protein